MQQTRSGGRRVRNWGALGALTALVLAAGCGDSGTSPVAAHEQVSGTYLGELAGIQQGVALTGAFSLTITQSGGDLGGSWSLAGELTDGFEWADILGTGALTGTIGTGQNPSVNITIRNACPNYEARFSGSYDVANRLITLSGPVDILSSNCVVTLRYPMTILLRR